MKFKFDINKTDKDYTERTIFFNTKTEVGKMYDLILRITIVVLCGGAFLIEIFKKDFSPEWLIIYAIYWLVPLIVLQIIIRPLFVFSLKLLCKFLVKGKGKKPYTVFETIEFYGDYIVQTEEYVKSEIQYPIFESVYVVEGKGVYLNVSKGQAQMLPEHCFASPEQKKEFVEFIKTKCPKVVYYK